MPARQPAAQPKRKRERAPPTRVQPEAKFRVRIMAGDVIAIGPGKVALIEAIDETGSITAAAKRLQMSYRRAWLLLNELNRALKQPAVDSATGGQHGGGSALTPTGRELVEAYRRIESSAAKACRADLARLVGLIAP